MALAQIHRIFFFGFAQMKAEWKRACEAYMACGTKFSSVNGNKLTALCLQS